MSWHTPAVMKLAVGRAPPAFVRCANDRQCDIQQRWRCAAADCCLLRTFGLESLVNVISGED